MAQRNEAGILIRKMRRELANSAEKQWDRARRVLTMVADEVQHGIAQGGNDSDCLTPEQFSKVVDMINNPPPATQALKDALRASAPQSAKVTVTTPVTDVPLKASVTVVDPNKAFRCVDCGTIFTGGRFTCAHCEADLCSFCRKEYHTNQPRTGCAAFASKKLMDKIKADAHDGHYSTCKACNEPASAPIPRLTVPEMNITQAVKRACAESTLVDALTWIAVWESERAIKQAMEFQKTEVRTGANGAGWDTCFKLCFEEVTKAWNDREKLLAQPLTTISDPIVQLTDLLRDAGLRPYIRQSGKEPGTCEHGTSMAVVCQACSALPQPALGERCLGRCQDINGNAYNCEREPHHTGPCGRIVITGDGWVTLESLPAGSVFETKDGSVGMRGQHHMGLVSGTLNGLSFADMPGAAKVRRLVAIYADEAKYIEHVVSRLGEGLALNLTELRELKRKILASLKRGPR